jgi:hypothetical protein
MSHPTKDTAEEVAKRHGKDAVIVFHVDAQESQWGYASYGKDRAHCEAARGLADAMYEAGEKHLMRNDMPSKATDQ